MSIYQKFCTATLYVCLWLAQRTYKLITWDFSPMYIIVARPKKEDSDES